MHRLRLAIPADIPGLQALIELSVRKLSVGYYTEAQVKRRAPFRVRTGYSAHRGPNLLCSRRRGRAVTRPQAVGARRRTLFGGDQMKDEDDPVLDPTKDAARIRAFFVHPSWSGRGLGRKLFNRCAADAMGAGFRSVELMATLPGEPFYRALGFVELERSVVSLTRWRGVGSGPHESSAPSIARPMNH